MQFSQFTVLDKDYVFMPENTGGHSNIQIAKNGKVHSCLTHSSFIYCLNRCQEGTVISGKVSRKKLCKKCFPKSAT